LTASSREEQIRKLAFELQLMQGSVETLQQRLQILQTAITDLGVADASIGALKEAEEGAPILLPAGGGTFVNAVLGDLSHVIVGIGADVSVEMDLDEAQEDVSGRLEEVEGASQSVQQQLGQILSQMQVHQDRLNRLSAELRGEAPGV
jgi:prefoldin alpha subunit